MRIWKLFGGEEIAAMLFKPVEGGFVFKTVPFAGALGLGAYYRVDAEAKADLTALYVRVWRLSMLAIAPLVVAMIALKGAVPALAGGYEILIALAMGLLIGLAAWTCYGLALRSRLAGAQRVTDKITWGEQQRAMLEHMPLWRIVTFGAFSAIMVALMMLNWRSDMIPHVHKVFTVVLFGLTTLYFVALAVAKARLKARAR